MKSERRHELEHNVLATWVAKLVENTKPYANVILGGVVLVTIVAIGATLLIRKSQAEATQAWDEFYAAASNQSVADLTAVTEHYPNTEVAHWAQVLQGDLRLRLGCDDRFTSRESAKKELGKAIEAYDAVMSETTNSVIRERATFGLARAWESQGDLEKATKFYGELVKGWPEGAYTSVAEERIAALANPAVKEFYDEFAKFDPSPLPTEDVTRPLEFGDRDMPKLGDGPLGDIDLGSPLRGSLGSEKPLDTSAKPDAGSSTSPSEKELPGAADAKQTATEAENAAKGSAAEVKTPTSDDSKPADSKPADPKPTDSKPVDPK